MAFINPYYLSNKLGIPRIESTGVTVGAANVAINFSSNVNFSRPFSGLILAKLSQAIPEGTDEDLPIVFSSASGGTKELKLYNNEPVTVGDVTGTGIYIVYYDSASSYLQVI